MDSEHTANAHHGAIDGDLMELYSKGSLKVDKVYLLLKNTTPLSSSSDEACRLAYPTATFSNLKSLYLNLPANGFNKVSIEDKVA
jgi:hypothetical protein